MNEIDSAHDGAVTGKMLLTWLLEWMPVLVFLLNQWQIELKEKKNLSQIPRSIDYKKVFKAKYGFEFSFKIASPLRSEFVASGISREITLVCPLRSQFWIDTELAYFNLFVLIRSSAAAYLLLFSNWGAATSFVTLVCNLVPAPLILTLHSFHCLWECK